MAEVVKSLNIPQIEKLRGATNYHIWRSIATTFLDIMGVWDVVTGKTPKPDATDATAEAAWIRLSQPAKGFILLNIDRGLMPLISTASDAPTAWAKLEEKFDRKTTTSLHSLLKTIVTLRCSNKREIAAHIEKYDELWQRLLERTSEATLRSRDADTTPKDTLEAVLLPLASSAIAKGAFFLTSLPTTLDNVVDNLTTKESATYSEVCTRLLDLYPAEQPAETNTAFASMSSNRNNRGRSKDEKICTYCKSKGFRGIGHLVAECRTRKKDTGGQASAVAALADKQKGYAFMAVENEFPPDAWILDSGASSHMTPDASRITGAQSTNVMVTIGNGEQLQATAIGTASFTALLANGSTHHIRLHNTLLVPALHFSLLSWRRMAEAGASKTGDALGTTISVNKNTVLETIPYAGLEIICMPSVIGTVSVMQLHRKLAHLPPSAFSTLQTHTNGLPPVPTVKGTFDCNACSKGKFTRTIPKVRTTSSPAPYHTVHSDICGPFSVPTPSSSKYFISAIDEYSHRAEVRFLKTRDEAPKALLDMLNIAACQYSTQVKVLQTDNAGELTSRWFEDELAKLGVKHKLSIAYIHETNGMAERFNRTATGSARTLLFDSSLPLSLWGEALTHAIYTKNRMPHPSLNNKSPDEVLTGEVPNIGYLQPFGSPAHVFIPEERRRVGGKLLARTAEGFLVGYGEQRNHYRFWIPSLHRVVISRDFKARVVTSVPNVMTVDTSSPEPLAMAPATQDISSTSPSPSAVTWTPASMAEIHDNYPNLFESSPPEPSSLESATPPSIVLSAPDSPTLAPSLSSAQVQTTSSAHNNREEPPEEVITCQPPPGIRTRSGRGVRPPSRLGEWGEVALLGSVNEDSPSISKALSGSEAGEWKIAMEKEIASLEKYNTWEATAPPVNGRFVDTKWVLRKKRDEHGHLVKFKARLTARGFTQIPGIDYDETFSAVVRTDTLRILLAHALQHNLHIVQYDIESAYLNAPLDDEIYIKPPRMVTVPDGKVLRLKKSIYGLKQAARCWGETLAAVLRKRGFLPSIADPALYINHQGSEFLGVHVDDLLFVAKADNGFSSWLGTHFTVNNLGRPRHLLSIELTWASTSVSLSQTAYLHRIINKYLPSGAKPLVTPLSPSERPLKRDPIEPSTDLKDYQSAIGSLLYAAIVTRPDILFSVCCLSQFLSDPSESHMRMVKNIFRYLANTIHYKLTYHQQKEKPQSILVAYSDSSYANSLSDRRSFSGSVTFFAGCPVAWSCAKQAVVALSTTEAEYIALTLAAQSLAWAQSLLVELRISSTGNRPLLYGDNLSSHFLTRNASLHRRSKHIDVRYHYIRERYEQGHFELQFVSGKENPADLFTKALQGDRLSYLCSRFFT